MDKKIYWIGGSPCSGKSSLAETMSKKHNFYYYKCDDFLEDYLSKGVKNNIPIMKKFKSMDINETWLGRSVDEQVQDEIEFYIQAFNFIKEDIKKLEHEEKIIVEGAAILPHNIIKENLDINDYFCIVPTKGFQVENYSKREWVKHYLSECSNVEKAFSNWMERDANFAEIIKNKAIENNMKVIVEDGSKSVNDRYLEILKHWEF